MSTDFPTGEDLINLVDEQINIVNCRLEEEEKRRKEKIRKIEEELFSKLTLKINEVVKDLPRFIKETEYVRYEYEFELDISIRDDQGLDLNKRAQKFKDRFNNEKHLTGIKLTSNISDWGKKWMLKWG